YIDFGKARPQATEHDLDLVLTALAAGKPVPYASRPAIGCAIADLSAHLSAVTFHHDIAPILYRYCAPCHRPGEAAPFSLLSCDDARRHASQIGVVTKSRYMPPWLLEPGAGDFVGSRRLSQTQLDLIATWLRTGMAAGDPAIGPPSPSYTEGWQLGPPDLIVQVPRPFHLPATGGDVFRNFVIPVHVDRTTYVRAVELRPGDRNLVHHANIVIDRARSLRLRDGIDGQPGFPGMDVSTESGDLFDPDSHFLFWKPGTVPEPEPEDMAWRLDPETDLILNLHLQPSGKAETVQPSVGIYFSKMPPTRFPMLLQLEHDGAIDIPAGSKTFTVADELTLPVAVDLLKIYSHAHYLGKRVEAWANLPDGTRRPLIQIDDWDLNWQAVYTYREPMHLPKGTVVAMRIVYDNTAENPRNPNHPPERVKNGDRAGDEMGHVWLQVVAADRKPDPRLALQEAAMLRRLFKYPADVTAHYNLGALYQLQNRTPRAIEQYRAALEADPAQVSARNALGSALLAEGRNSDAIGELRETLRLQPQYSDAHFNLARALLGVDDRDGAIREYATYIRQRPADARARLNLGAIYISLHRFDLALPEYRRACELVPDSDSLTDFGALLARTGNLPEAISAFRKALELDPKNEIARKNLARSQKY
ncbi:MAG: tetratricopeptide repeat protein, partial [Acidobacteriota bacterium]|nr:tetratricopeptide repeat protein [Acidobacteriota bacterium]